MLKYQAHRYGPTFSLSINEVINKKARLTAAFVYIDLKGHIYRIPSKKVNRLDLNHEIRRTCPKCGQINDIRATDYCENCKYKLR